MWCTVELRRYKIERVERNFDSGNLVETTPFKFRRSRLKSTIFGNCETGLPSITTPLNYTPYERPSIPKCKVTLQNPSTCVSEVTLDSGRDGSNLSALPRHIQQQPALAKQ